MKRNWEYIPIVLKHARCKICSEVIPDAAQIPWKNVQLTTDLPQVTRYLHPLYCCMWGHKRLQLYFSTALPYILLQNRRQKVFSRGALRLCRGLGILKFDKNSTYLQCFIFQFGGLELCLGATPIKAHSWRRDCTTCPRKSRQEFITYLKHCSCRTLTWMIIEWEWRKYLSVSTPATG